MAPQTIWVTPRRSESSITLLVHALARLWHPLSLLVAAYALLICTWVVSNQPGGGPDEAAHYLKALAVGRGTWLGNTLPAPSTAASFAATPFERQQNWASRQTRTIDVPPHLELDGTDCNGFKPEIPASCLPPLGTNNVAVVRRDYVATYEPALYVVPGLLMHWGSDAYSALLWGRAGFGLISLLLLGMACLVLWDRKRGAFSLLGLLCAVTPMVIYLAAELSASGAEIAASICFTAALLRLARQESDTKWVWIAVAVGGGMLALSRSLGPLWVVFDVVLFIAIVGIKGAWRRCQLGGTRALVVGGVIVAAIAINVVWDEAFQPRVPFELGAALQASLSQFGALSELLREQVGIFGAIDTVMPDYMYILWGAVILAIIGLALLVGTRRQRWILLGLTAGSLLVTLCLYGFLLAPISFGLLGRYSMAATITVPLYAGEVVFLNLDKLGALAPRRLPLYAGIVVAVVQFAALYVAARRYAVGIKGPIFFLGHDVWQPPLGWTVWLVVGLVAAVLLVVFVSQSLRLDTAEATGSTNRRST